MKKTKKPVTRTFKFLSESAIRSKYFDLTSWQSVQLRSKLAKSIYWIQPIERGKIHWNITLLQDYIFNGDRPEHQAMIEEFVATLPQSA